MYKFYPKSIKRNTVFTVISFCALVIGIVLLCLNKEIVAWRNIALTIVAFSSMCFIISGLQLISDARSYILVDEEKLVLPQKREIVLEELRSVSVYYTEPRKPSFLGIIFSFIMSVLLLESIILGDGREGSYDCTLHFKDNTDMDISFVEYSEIAAKEIIATIKTKCQW